MTAMQSQNPSTDAGVPAFPIPLDPDVAPTTVAPEPEPYVEPEPEPEPTPVHAGWAEVRSLDGTTIIVPAFKLPDEKPDA